MFLRPIHIMVDQWITINWNAPLAWVTAFLDEQGAP